MLAYLSGKIARCQPKQILIKTAFGMGFLIWIWDERDFIVNQNVELYVYEHRREDRTELFGFRDWSDREWMSRLLVINGVGAKIAASIVYQLGLEGIQNALKHQDPTLFTQVSGVGPKLAKKIILDLKGVLVEEISIVSSTFGTQVSVQFSETLSNLGYKKGEIVSLISEMKKEKLWDESSLENLVREGIKRMGKTGNF